jgi:aspartate dehydrogenase
MFHFTLYTKMQKKHKIAVIGFGAVTEEILRCLVIRNSLAQLTGILVKPSRLDAMREKAAGKFPVLGTLDAMLETKPDIVIEAAGHGSVKQFGADIVQRGTDLLIASVGVLADDGFSGQLEQTCANGGNAWITAGAVAGMDGLLAARSLSLRSVKYISVKPPQAWSGTPGEAAVRANSNRRIAFFSGSAREAAIYYPQNANVAATIALASIGLDRTQIELVSDPEAPGPLGIIEADGDFGRFHFDILALASPSNPKTSAITGHSLVSAAFDGMRFSAFPKFCAD